MKKYQTIINYQATKELTRGSLIRYQVMALLGVALILTYVILGVTLDMWGKSWSILMLLLSIVLMFFGFFYCFMILRTRKTAKTFNVIMNYQFHTDHVMIQAIKGSEPSKPIKLDYSGIRFYKDSPNYLFLFVSAANAFPLIKGPELDEIKKMIHIEIIRKRFF